MPFEHFLEPDDGPFSADAVAAMHERVRAQPHHVWPDGAYTVYASTEERDAADTSGAADYIHAIVHISPERVLVATVGDPVADGALRALVEAVQARWPSSLYYGGERVSAESLTA